MTSDLSCDRRVLDAGRTERFLPHRSGRPLSFGDVLRGWESDAAFRLFFVSLLIKSPFESFRWETPALSAATVNSPFEFVLLDAPALQVTADPRPFAEHFGSAAAGRQFVVFDNLGRDATLIVPTAAAPVVAYAHLAAFVRLAPADQVDALWRAVGTTVGAKLSTDPLWLSTAGMGVAWLHVRIDSRPKYYGFRQYRTVT